MMQISQGTLGTPWHQTYHSSSSTSDLSGYEHGYLRRSPDQYSSRGSMESLEHTTAEYPCLLSPAKSTNSIDQLAQLHYKRDSAYSSFSTNSSIPEYQLPTFCKKRPFSMENMHSRCSPHERMKQADIKYVKTVYDAQRGVSEEYEVHSSSLLKNREGQIQAENWSCGRAHGKARYTAWNPHSRSVSESDNVHRGAPLPPSRSDSYAAIKHRENTSSLLNHDQSISCQMQTKGVCPQPMNATSSDQGQLHAVLDKNSEGSPTVKSKQNCPHALQPGQPMLPTGVYPVPMLEPHFAQAPQHSSGINGMLYPALAKESGYTPPAPGSFQKVQSTDPLRNAENINQTTNTRLTVSVDLEGAQHSLANQDNVAMHSQYKPHLTPNPEVPTSSSGKCKGERVPSNYQIQGSREITDRTEYSSYIPQPPQAHLRSASESTFLSQPSEHWRSEVQEERETNLWRRERDSIDRAYWAPEKNKQGIASLQSNSDLSRRKMSVEASKLQEWGRHHSGVNLSSDKKGDDERRQANKHLTDLDRSNFTRHNGGTASPMPRHSPQPKYEPPSSPVEAKSCGFGRSRLSSSSTQSSQGFHFGKSDGSKSRCSVLEKISKFEQREQESQRSHSTGGIHHIYHNGLGRSSQSSSTRSSLNSIEDLRSKFDFHEQPRINERTRSMSMTSTEKTPQAQPLPRTARIRPEEAQCHAPKEERSAKQLDKAVKYHNDYGLNSVQVQGSTAEPHGNKSTSRRVQYEDKEENWKEDAPDVPASQLDHLFHRAYRNSIKDAQSKVLRATSFRRKDLNVNPPFVNKAKNETQRPNYACDGGKTLTTSPHAPKERHRMTPTESSATTQEYANKEYQVARIGSRKRMTPEQKKRSYSEPEKMNEVGVADTELSPHCSDKKGMELAFQENTVADRRRMFEREKMTCSTINLSKPELKQLQQNALADYIERKTGRRSSPQETRFLKERSQSSYFQTNMQDDQSISSALSMSSLQDQGLHHSWRDPDEQPRAKGRVSSTLPPGLTGCFDLNSFEQKTENHESRARSSSFANLHLLGMRPDNKYKMESNPGYRLDQHEHLGQSNFMKKESCPESYSPSKKSVKSVSAEDLLDRPAQQTFTLHVRSSSSPSADTKAQDLMLGREIHESSHLAKDRIFSVGTETSSFKREDTSYTRKTESPSRCYSQQDIRGSEKQLPSMHSRRASEFLIYGRTTGLGPSSAEQSSQRIGRRHDETSPAGPVHTTTSHSIHPSARLAVEGECPVLEEPGQVVLTSAHKGMQTSPVGWISHNSISADGSKEEKVKKKPPPPKRPPPPKIKWANSVNEDNLANKTQCSSTPGLKFVPRWQSLGTRSSSSSETETNLGPQTSHGKISLRISESYLQISPSLPLQDDDDDEVFVTETEFGAAKVISESPLPPPSPPSPSLEEKAFSRTTEDFPHPPPGEEVQTVEKQLGLEDGITTCHCTKITTDEEKPVASIPSEKTSWYNSLNQETPLSSAGLNVYQHLSTTPEERQNTDSLPPAMPNSTPGEASPAHDSKDRSFCSECYSSMHGTRKLMTQEEIKSLKLAKEIISKDRSLAEVLDPDSKMKTTMHLMEGLFPKSSRFMKENNVRRKKLQRSVNQAASEEDKKEENEASGNVDIGNTSQGMFAPKVELLNHIQGLRADMTEEDQQSLNEKKNELISSLSHKLAILNEAKESLLADIKLNNVLGEDVETLIKDLCKTNEFDKYKMFIGDLDKVVNLLLSLSGRLARVENVLNGLGEDAIAEEKNSLNKKRVMLAGQYEDARELKENLDRRERVVLDILGKYLSEEQFQDFQHFVKMKSALLIEQRELEDKIKLGQEQLKCLVESLHEQPSPWGMLPLTGTKGPSLGALTPLVPVTSSF